MKINKFLTISLQITILSLSMPVSVRSQQLDQSKIPVVSLSNDWRSPSPNVPWSVPVFINDDFEGRYLAVFDKNYRINRFPYSEDGIVSNWSRRNLRIYAYRIDQHCTGGFFCKNETTTKKASSVAIKVRDRVFHLDGSKGDFLITEEIAGALKNAPSGEAKIRIGFDALTGTIDSNIGSGTVEAWKTVYY